MKYKLYEKSDNNMDSPIRTILVNRGIENYKEYLSLSYDGDNEKDNDYEIHFSNLDSIFEAVNMFMDHFNKNNKIYIVVDTDPDGYCSAAMMYSYIKEMNKDYPVEYIMHNKAKSHNLDDVVIPDDAKLVIVPDAGTNDVEECMALKERGIDVIILDHHEKEEDNPYAIIVNNQISKDYSNKNLCGAGIVYKFLQALDEEYWNCFADNYLDLVALANISDVMDMREFETKYLVSKGISNINNKLFKALIEAQDYSMNGEVTINSVQWYITPILNGMIRIGSKEDKEITFRAFIEDESETFEQKKRATKNKPAEVVIEDIYTHTARICKNTKSRQDRMRDKCITEIFKVKKNKEDKVVLIDGTDIVDGSLTGVVAMKAADIYKKPVIILRKTGTVYNGSARNVNDSPIERFKDVVNSIDFLDGRGHANAFGIVGLEENNFDKALKELNEKLKDVVYDTTYKVDFIMEPEDINIGFVYEISKMKDLIGQGIEEPMIAIENIRLNKSDFSVFGSKEDTISFYIDDIKFIQFRCKNGDKLYDWLNDAWDDEDEVTFNLIGVPGINKYEGKVTPQVMIKDIEIVSEDNL